jgi:hypothetical protein
MPIVSNSSGIEKIDFIGVERAPFKKGDLFLNGKRITSSKGEAKLVLVSNNKTLNITDPSKLLLSLYEHGKIGRGGDKFIQIVGKDSDNRSVDVRYSTKAINTNKLASLNLVTPTTIITKIRDNIVFNNAQIVQPQPIVLPDVQPEPIVLPDVQPEPIVLPDVQPEPIVLPDVQPEPIVLPDVQPQPAYGWGSLAWDAGRMVWGVTRYAANIGVQVTSATLGAIYDQIT